MKKRNSKTGALAICSTGVEGLDDILGGGLPCHRLYLLQGNPGVGKTTLALQFLLEGVRRDEGALYIALSETVDEMEAMAKSHGWSLDKIRLFEFAASEAHLGGEADNTFFHPSEVELNRLTQALMDTVRIHRPKRVVFDSLSELRMLAETPLRYRRQILQFKRFFAEMKCTVLFVDDSSFSQDMPQIESIAHGVITLKRTSPAYGVARRQLTVEKIRGVRFREGNHDLVIQRGGLEIFPRLVASDHHSMSAGPVFASGIETLDRLLGGGLDRGTSTMLLGPPGTGKSTLAIKFAHVAAKRGERVMMFVFDESPATLLARSAQLGMNLGPFLKRGLIDIRKINPAEISPGEFTDVIRRSVEESNARMVVIDSINGYLNAMPEERFLHLQLHELLEFLNKRGVVSIMVLAQQGLWGAVQSAVDLTYLADTVVLLRYFEAFGEVKQALSIIKKRSGNHERTIREIRMDKSGIHLSEPLKDFHGVLTGIPIMNDNNFQSSRPRDA